MGTRTNSNIRLIRKTSSSGVVENNEPTHAKKFSYQSWVVPNPKIPRRYLLGQVSPTAKKKVIERIDKMLDDYFEKNPHRRRQYGLVVAADEYGLPKGSNLVRHHNDMGADMFTLAMAIDDQEVIVTIDLQPQENGQYCIRGSFNIPPAEDSPLVGDVERALNFLFARS